MSYVLDASSILALTRRFGERIVDLSKGNFTPSLAYYEIGNALWKECNLLKRLNMNEVNKTLEFTFSLLKLMQIIPIEDSNLGLKTLSNANKLNITYYDAAYLTVTKQLDKILVTEDEKLTKAARKIGVKTSSTKNMHLRNVPT